MHRASILHLNRVMAVGPAAGESGEREGGVGSGAGMSAAVIEGD